MFMTHLLDMDFPLLSTPAHAVSGNPWYEDLSTPKTSNTSDLIYFLQVLALSKWFKILQKCMGSQELIEELQPIY